MSRFYGGSSARIGWFPGKLVCLRCDIQPGPNAMAQCEKAGHRHALSMDGAAIIHPLLADAQPVLQRINSGERPGKEVTVPGRYYPATNAILVDRIEEKKYRRGLAEFVTAACAANVSTATRARLGTTLRHARRNA